MLKQSLKYKDKSYKFSTQYHNPFQHYFSFKVTVVITEPFHGFLFVIVVVLAFTECFHWLTFFQTPGVWEWHFSVSMWVQISAHLFSYQTIKISKSYCANWQPVAPVRSQLCWLANGQADCTSCADGLVRYVAEPPELAELVKSAGRINVIGKFGQ